MKENLIETITRRAFCRGRGASKYGKGRMWCRCKQLCLVTIVQLPHQLDVPGTDSITLTDHLERLVSLLQNVNIMKANVLHSRVMSFDLHAVAVVAPWPIASICAVMHQTVKVIRKSKVV